MCFPVFFNRFSEVVCCVFIYRPMGAYHEVARRLWAGTPPPPGGLPDPPQAPVRALKNIKTL